MVNLSFLLGMYSNFEDKTHPNSKLQTPNSKLQTPNSKLQTHTFTGTLCTALLISLMSDTSFSMALPTTITSAPALQLR